MAAERRVALCVARFYTDLADALEQGARAALDEAGVDAVESFTVPGAFELPLVAKYAAESGRFDAVVCLGAVIRGETDHYDYVCSAATDGITQVQLETGVPCGFGVLTFDTMEQALARVTGGSKRDTGRHAVEDHVGAACDQGGDHGECRRGWIGGNHDRLWHELRLSGQRDTAAVASFRLDAHRSAEMGQHLLGVVARRLGFDHDGFARGGKAGEQRCRLQLRRWHRRPENDWDRVARAGERQRQPAVGTGWGEKPASRA